MQWIRTFKFSYRPFQFALVKKVLNSTSRNWKNIFITVHFTDIIWSFTNLSQIWLTCTTFSSAIFFIAIFFRAKYFINEFSYGKSGNDKNHRYVSLSYTHWYCEELFGDGNIRLGYWNRNLRFCAAEDYYSYVQTILFILHMYFMKIIRSSNT